MPGNSAGDLLAMVKWPFQRLSDLQLGDKKVTLNHPVYVFLQGGSSHKTSGRSKTYTHFWRDWSCCVVSSIKDAISSPFLNILILVKLEAEEGTWSGSPNHRLGNVVWNVTMLHLPGKNTVFCCHHVIQLPGVLTNIILSSNRMQYPLF